MMEESHHVIGGITYSKREDIRLFEGITYRKVEG